MVGLKSCQLRCAGGQSSLSRSRAALSVHGSLLLGCAAMWLCLGSVGLQNGAWKRRKGKRRGLVGPVLGAVEKDVDQHRT